MLETLLASNAASSFFGGLGKGLMGDPGPVVSGAPVDARSFMDGSGWTVSTGSSRATGGARTQTGDPFGASSATAPAAPMQAGVGQLGMVVLLLVVAGAMWKRAT